MHVKKYHIIQIQNHAYMYVYNIYILYYIILYCIILYYVKLYYIILYYHVLGNTTIINNQWGFKAYEADVPPIAQNVGEDIEETRVALPGAVKCCGSNIST